MATHERLKFKPGMICWSIDMLDNLKPVEILSEAEGYKYRVKSLRPNPGVTYTAKDGSFTVDYQNLYKTLDDAKVAAMGRYLNQISQLELNILDLERRIEIYRAGIQTIQATQDLPSNGVPDEIPS